MAEFRIEPFRPEIPGLGQASGLPGGRSPEKTEPGTGSNQELSFHDSIRNFVHDVDGMQKDAAGKIQDFIAGDISNVHDVMLAVEKAGTSFQLLMELRNKMLDAYQEIKRMST